MVSHSAHALVSETTARGLSTIVVSSTLPSSNTCSWRRQPGGGSLRSSAPLSGAGGALSGLWSRSVSSGMLAP